MPICAHQPTRTRAPPLSTRGVYPRNSPVVVQPWDGLWPRPVGNRHGGHSDVRVLQEHSEDASARSCCCANEPETSGGTYPGRTHRCQCTGRSSPPRELCPLQLNRARLDSSAAPKECRQAKHRPPHGPAACLRPQAPKDVGWQLQHDKMRISQQARAALL